MLTTPNSSSLFPHPSPRCNVHLGILADTCAWTAAHHLELNLCKSELLFIPGKDCPHIDLSVTVKDVTISHTWAYSLTTDCSAPPTSLLWPDPADLPSTTSPGSGLSSQKNKTQLLFQALVISLLDYCNSLLVGLPASVIKPLQCIQNTAACLIYNLPKFSHVTSLLRDLCWLPVAARIWFKMTVLAFKAINETVPVYLQTLVRLVSVPLRCFITHPKG